MADKLKSFEDAIMQQAKKQCDAIDKQLEDYKQTELTSYEDDVLEDAYNIIQSEVSEIRAASTTEISQKTLEYKRALFAKRDEYSAKIFDAAKEKLLNFTKTPDYKAFLLSIVKNFSETATDGGVVITVKPEDEAFSAEIKQAYGADCTIETSKKIAIGGAILRNPANGLIYDETLDSKLFDQREWFHNNSGFTAEL